MRSRFPNMEVIATTICISMALGSTRGLHAPSAAHALWPVSIPRYITLTISPRNGRKKNNNINVLTE